MTNTFTMDDLPNSAYGPAEEGEVVATISEVKMGTSKTTKRPQMIVTFETEAGTKVNEFYQISDKPFMMYKLKSFLIAAEIKLPGEITLETICGIAPRGKKVILTLEDGGNGYSNISYKGSDGVMPYVFDEDGNVASPETAESLLATANAEPKLDIVSDADTFAQPAQDQKEQPEVQFTSEDF